jgi:cardiolipin synthase C
MSTLRYTFPPRKNRPVTNVLRDEEAVNTRIGKEIRARLLEHPGESGVHPLQNAHDAFAARALLAQTAEKTLDVQYYIWKNDLTGTLLFKALLDAADRGVRVRLLLDDNGISGMDTDLAALNLHANIQTRLFNPLSLRTPKWLGFITNFSLHNRRMHNKSFIADNQAAIVGGRNIGDEYFGTGSGQLFADMDVLLIGPVVKEISDDFDKYWNSPPSIPADQILRNPEKQGYDNLLEKTSKIEKNPAASGYVNAIRKSRFVQDLFSGELRLEWAVTRLVSDDPSKVLGNTKPEQLLTHQVRRIIGWPEDEVILVSPYFVPTGSGVEVFKSMVKNDVDVRILTNSLDATDVKIVHAGYEKYRIALLKEGVKLYEMKRKVTDSEFQKLAGPFGTSGSSLHAKTFSADRKRVFVGSFNFDPRSVNLNTEMGVVIESPALASDISDIFGSRVPENAYQVRLNENEKLYWIEQNEGRKIIHNREPETGLLNLLFIRFLSRLPIEWLL